MTTTIQPPPAPPTYVDKPVPTSLGRLSQQPMAAIPVDLLDCQDGAQARIQLIDGIELIQAKPVVTVQLDSPDACLHICRLNAVILMCYQCFSLGFSTWMERSFPKHANQALSIVRMADASFSMEPYPQTETSTILQTLTASTSRSFVFQVCPFWGGLLKTLNKFS